MPKATWNGVVIAEAPESATVALEGNIYFPAASVDKTHLKPSDKHTTCPWKGTASYYDLEVAGKVNAAAAWYYPEPKSAAENIRGRIAFWKGVEVTS